MGDRNVIGILKLMTRVRNTTKIVLLEMVHKLVMITALQNIMLVEGDLACSVWYANQIG
jgi:hypothetical protein